MKSVVSALRTVIIYVVSLVICILVATSVFVDAPIIGLLSILIVPFLITWGINRHIKKVDALSKKIGQPIGIFEFSKQKRLEQEYDAKKQALFDSLNGDYASFEEWVQKSEELRNFIKNDDEAKADIEDFDAIVKLKIDVRTHLAPLRRNIEKAKTYNEYGALINDASAQEIERFLISIGYHEIQASADVYHNIVLETLDHYASQLTEKGFDPETLPSDGLEFEYWVAENLRLFGWDATPTVGSGDQGLDVIASKNGIRVGVQCKLYSSNVGNKAVQEIISAKTFFDLDAAAVLTNAGYTTSARDLASKSGVKLLSHHDLPDFDDIFLNTPMIDRTAGE